MRVCTNFIAALLLTITASAQTFETQFKIRVGRPHVANGPKNKNVSPHYGFDNLFNVIPLSGTNPTQYRGFMANQNTWYMDNTSIKAMSDAAPNVSLARNTNIDWARCGFWINDTHKAGTTTWAFIHAETMNTTSCPYTTSSQPTKSMAIANSSTQGTSWSTPAQIMRSAPAVPSGPSSSELGTGDCRVVEDGGFFYMYCRRNGPRRTIVARAPSGDPNPGNWFNYAGSADTYDPNGWTQPSLDGSATTLKRNGVAGWFGASASLWTSPSPPHTVILGTETGINGIRMSFSADHVVFKSVPDPLLFYDAYEWSRPAATELIAYPVAIDPSDGNDRWSNSFMLGHLYIEPGGGNDRQFLVFRDVSIVNTGTPQTVNVGVELSRWFRADRNDHWSTTGPAISADDVAPGPPTKWAYQAGTPVYLLTSAKANTQPLYDCVSQWPAPEGEDHMITKNLEECTTNGFSKLRTAGWTYSSASVVPAGVTAVELRRCYDPEAKSHYAAPLRGQAACDSGDTDEIATAGNLGWALDDGSSCNGICWPANANKFENIEELGAYAGGVSGEAAPGAYVQDTNDNGDGFPCDQGATGNNDQLWLTQRDCGTGGGKTGNTSNLTPGPGTPPTNTAVRKYKLTSATVPTGSGANPGIRWSVKLVSDEPDADTYQNFGYDAWVYFENDGSLDRAAVLELDINQVTGIGTARKLYIMSHQCNFKSGRWQIGGWTDTDQPCSRSQFSAGTWHHVQIQVRRETNPDKIVFQKVAVDGAVQNLTCGGGGSCTWAPKATGWSPGAIIPNFQVNAIGSTSAGITVYSDLFHIYRWPD